MTLISFRLLTSQEHVDVGNDSIELLSRSDAARELNSREFSRIPADQILENEFSVLEKLIFENIWYFSILTFKLSISRSAFVRESFRRSFDSFKIW